MSMAQKVLASSLAAVIASLLAPSAALACIPPRSPTVARQEAWELQEQADLWARHDMIFAAIVTAAGDEGPGALDPSASQIRIHDHIRVRLEPTVMVKGNQALPAPYEIRNIFALCFPQGIARGHVGQRYLIYGAPSSDLGRTGGIVEIDRLVHAETLLAVYQAAALAALEP